MYQAVVFFDLDGTLLRDDKTVADDTRNAITRLRANNILPVVATGRNVFEIQYVLDQTGINSIVSANGSYVQYEGQKLHAETIPVPLIERFDSFARAQGDVVGWYNNTGFALSGTNAATRENYQLLHLTANVDPHWYQHNPVNFMFTFNFDKAKLYQRHFAGQLSLVRNNPRGLDTMLTGVSKRTGIAHFLNQTGLAGLPTYAFGDELNDLEMLSMVDHPVAMGNGNDQDKALAEYVTTTNMNHGIFRGLRHFGLV
ncbi:Cof-type HAD-IIB family hydrolase [uncultured Lacticaseibacillus sp.]|uniref:Cof-type HAD-IIB family hydrolase n=1 Tax=uncultured Lacticaseibacillus sp. TaxID=2775882 RepID=UPI0025932B00|nr:Cof-type HAD-IIB family hydrolase [uncultured Lacticaseibacillus sp.]